MTVNRGDPHRSRFLGAQKALTEYWSELQEKRIEEENLPDGTLVRRVKPSLAEVQAVAVEDHHDRQRWADDSMLWKGFFEQEACSMGEMLDCWDKLRQVVLYERHRDELTEVSMQALGGEWKSIIPSRKVLYGLHLTQPDEQEDY